MVAKMLDYENPLSGKTGSITSLNDWKSLILGVVVVFIAVAVGTNIANMLAGKVGYFGGSSFGTPLVQSPAAVSSGPAMNIY